MRHCAAFSHGSNGSSMQNQLLEAALGIVKPWYVRGVDFDAARKILTTGIDFIAGSRFRRRVSRVCIRSMTPRPSG
jgi:hypothetical protein